MYADARALDRISLTYAADLPDPLGADLAELERLEAKVGVPRRLLSGVGRRRLGVSDAGRPLECDPGKTWWCYHQRCRDQDRPASIIASVSNSFIKLSSPPKTLRLAAFQLAILAAPYM